MFPMFRFVMLYKVVLTFQTMDEMVSVVIKIKATQHYVPVLLFIIIILLSIVAYFAGLNILARSDHQSEAHNLVTNQSENWKPFKCSRFFLCQFCLLHSLLCRL